eukprot:jgi/Mesen1/7010/ME000365S06138
MATTLGFFPPRFNFFQYTAKTARHNMPQVSATSNETLKLRLPDGRRVSYLEKGATPGEARHNLLVLHGLGSSRLANMPGVSDNLLRDFGVRLVAVDRAGYGRSDPAPSLTFESAAKDIALMADLLAFGDKFWLLGYSGGGAFCWAAARYIPERVAGIAMWAPVGCYFWKGITDSQRTEMMAAMSDHSRMLLQFGGHVPAFLTRLLVRYFMVPQAGRPWVERCQARLSEPDRRHLAQPRPAELMLADNAESIGHHNGGLGMAKDLELFHRRWPFEPAEVAERFKGPMHIWQGSDDNLVPASLQRWVREQVPGLVTLHELPREGHLSWFCYNEDAHREVLTTLFGERGEGGGDGVRARSHVSKGRYVEPRGRL